MTTPLQQAAWRGDRTAVRGLVKGGSAIDELGTAGLTALMFAAKEGNFRV